MKTTTRHKLRKGLVSFLIFVWLFIGLIPTYTYAQNPGEIIITGTITDFEGLPLPDAIIKEKGESNGTISDRNGQYSISVKPGAVLMYIFIGYETVERTVTNRTKIDVVLVEETTLMEEVVVTALGIQKHVKTLGYAFTEIKGGELTKTNESNAILSLAGRVPGMDVSSGSGGPAGSTRVVIRGMSQLSGDNMPFYIIDGVPIDGTQLGAADENGGYDLGDALTSINPSDIASISVLKGASAAALYGSRASNGVVLITTKSGKGQKGLGVEFSTNINAVKLLSKFDDYQRVYGQGASGQAPYQTSLAEGSTQSAWGAKLDPNLQTYIFNGQERSYANRGNNILSFFRTGVTWTNTLSLSNSTDKYDYRFSVSDMRNTDIVPSSNLSRTTFMLKSSAKLSKNLTAEGRVNYSREDTKNRPALSDSPGNIGNALIGIAPNFHQSWLKDGYKDEEGRYMPWNNNPWRLNPYWVINEMENTSNKNRLMGHLQLNYTILPYLSAQIRAGMDQSRFKFIDFAPMYTDGIEAGRMTQTLTEITEMNYEGILRFNKRIKEDYEISAFIGGNIRTYNYESYFMKGEKQIMNDIKSLSNYEVSYPTQPTLNRKQVNSLFGAVNLGYKEWLYLDFTLRNDISSTLHPGNWSYVYPSVSTSFILSDLIDLSNYRISFAKLRASWAKVGGDTNPYMLYLAYNSLPYTIDGKPAGQISNNYIMPNKDLKPTSTYSYEVGMDVRFFDGRLGLDVSVYNQSTKDQIMNLPISSPAGYQSAIINAGIITNRGLELGINYVPVRERNFEWTGNFSMAHNSNRIKKLHPELDTYELANARWGGASLVAKEGERYGAIMGRKFKRNENNRIIYDQNGMPTFEDQMSVLGNGNYDLTMGLGNTFRYRDFSLGLLFDMKFGAEVYSMSDRISAYNGTSKRTIEGRDAWYASEEARIAANKTINEWVPTGGLVGNGVVEAGKESNGAIIWKENTTPVDPQAYWQRITDNTPEPFIHDASYIKLREITFSYSIPQRILAKSILKEVTFTAYGRNLFILYTNLKNIDPESSYNSSNGQGFEYGSLPSRRNFGASVNIKL